MGTATVLPVTTQPEPVGRVLRDYLYVDVDKVKSIAGQLESGVPEEARLTRKDARRTTMGWSTFLSHSPETSEEGYLQRSMLDSLFPELEEILEQGWLLDVSEEFASGGGAAVLDRLADLRPEGSIFRLEADGYLFDVRHFASLFANVAAAVTGFQDLQKASKDLAESMAAQAGGSSPKKAPPKKTPRVESSTDESKQLEAAIEEFAPQFGMSPAVLRSMVHTARGVFTPGLHLMMANGTSEDAFTITSRLQESGRYLDASPEIVASRYGVKPQRWTLVGTVGHYSEDPSTVNLASLATQVENELADDFNRARFVRSLNNSVNDMAKSGMIDLPQHPGMSAIPIAVYRAVRGGPQLMNHVAPKVQLN